MYGKGVYESTKNGIVHQTNQVTGAGGGGVGRVVVVKASNVWCVVWGQNVWGNG